MIFVFGSNLAGRHGAGAAKTAREKYGAVYGVGEGHTGNSYAIPTKDENMRTRGLDAIQVSINTFMEYARANHELHFHVTQIGCGLAGYKPWQIAPLFKGAPVNCILPDGWRVK